VITKEDKSPFYPAWLLRLGPDPGRHRTLGENIDSAVLHVDLGSIRVHKGLKLSNGRNDDLFRMLARLDRTGPFFRAGTINDCLLLPGLYNCDGHDQSVSINIGSRGTRRRRLSHGEFSRVSRLLTAEYAFAFTTTHHSYCYKLTRVSTYSFGSNGALSSGYGQSSLHFISGSTVYASPSVLDSDS
jgi:hypothetical protein